MITSRHLALSDKRIVVLLMVCQLGLSKDGEKKTAVVLFFFSWMRHSWHHSINKFRWDWKFL